MPISPLVSLPPIAPPSPTAGTDSVSAPAAPSATPSGFAAFLDKASQLETSANTEAVKLATGESTSIHQFTAAAAKAQLAVELTAAVRNRAVDAFNEIMRMQV